MPPTQNICLYWKSIKLMCVPVDSCQIALGTWGAVVGHSLVQALAPEARMPTPSSPNCRQNIGCSCSWTTRVRLTEPSELFWLGCCCLRNTKELTHINATQNVALVADWCSVVDLELQRAHSQAALNLSVWSTISLLTLISVYIAIAKRAYGKCSNILVYLTGWWGKQTAHVAVMIMCLH